MKLDVVDVRSGYGTIPVLLGVSLSVEVGEIVAVVGRNGVGKTTLVKTLMGVLPVTSGTISIDGTDMTKTTPSRRVRRGLRSTYQERALFQDLTVADNLRVNGLDADQQRAVLERFPDSLTDRYRQLAGTLSGGEQKMLAAACALETEAPLLVMDEPTEGLQPSNVDLLGDHLDEARRTGRGIILIEQHLALAKRLADRFVVMEKGQVVEQGHAQESDIHTRIAERLAI